MKIGGYLIAGGVGAVIGSGLTLLFIRKKVREAIQEKVDEAKVADLRYRRLAAKYGEDAVTLTSVTEVTEKEPESDYETIVSEPINLKKIDYAAISNGEAIDILDEDPEARRSAVSNMRPYVIGVEENESSPPGDAWGYDYVQLTYYADGVLTDETDKPFDHIEDVLGTEWVNRFGELEADIVYVRNDSLKTDYEIVKDYRTYKEVVEEE